MATVAKIGLDGEIEFVDEFLEDSTQQPQPLTKQELLDSIKVITQAGNTFDGHQEARGNMMAAIMAAEIVGQSQSNWKMANNETVLITLDELKEALALSIQRVGEIVLAE